MRNALLSIAVLTGALVVLGASFGTVSITMPADQFHFKPGPGMDVTNTNCSTCHSAAYVYTQARLTRGQWTAEVNKMKAVYGAPIKDEDIVPIVDYLMTQNGK